jgi:hypothetical protein
MPTNNAQKIKCDVILNLLDENEHPINNCALMLDAHDPDLLSKIKDHVHIFKTMMESLYTKSD